MSPPPSGSTLGWNQELIPTDPSTPTPDVLWLLSNHDPFFYVGAMAAHGYIREAWKAMALPLPIKPWVPPRPVPAYIGASSSVGLFQDQLAPEFGG